MRFPPSLPVLTFILLGSLAVPASRARGEEPDEAPNACGCTRTGAGLCYCSKKAKCGCPGECEPKGCEEKRAKELEKQIREETRKAEQAGRVKERPDDDGAPKTAPIKEARDQKDQKDKEEKAPRPKLSTAQRRELARLLDAYLSDHPEAGGKTLEQTRRELVP
jgi:hypothetical protein